MNNKLETTDKKSLLNAIESNLDDFYIKCSNHPNFNSQRNDKINWVQSKYADWPDCIFRVNFKDLDIETEINLIKKLIKEKMAPNAWTVGPLTKPPDLGSILESYNFSNIYHQAGMALNLYELIDKDIELENLDIKVVQNETMLQQWVNTVSVVFKIKIDLELSKYLLFEKESRFYLGFYNGKPVSTLLLYLSSGVAGLHAVSTLPDYRNKGFGLAISGVALKEAYKLGYKISVLQASELGEKVYRKFGFNKYCDIFSYELQE
ncbi:MAG: GNAT family N-acetyltransferase [Promethearchaeota archaeon]|jgi:GNAT superfamily N-acetyltransferase